jgi:hypothetical protein
MLTIVFIYAVTQILAGILGLAIVLLGALS